MRKMIFFGSLFVDKRSRKVSATKIAESFLDETPEKNILATFATHAKLKLLFVKYMPCRLAQLSNVFCRQEQTFSGPKERDYQTSISKC